MERRCKKVERRMEIEERWNARRIQREGERRMRKGCTSDDNGRTGEGKVGENGRSGEKVKSRLEKKGKVKGR